MEHKTEWSSKNPAMVTPSGLNRIKTGWQDFSSRTQKKNKWRKLKMSVLKTTTNLTSDKKSSQIVISSIHGTLIINWINDNICRIRFADDGRFSASALIRYGFIKNDWPSVNFKVAESAGLIITESKSLKIQIVADSLKLKFVDGDGKTLLEDAEAPKGNQTNDFKVSFVLPKKTAFFGLGDQSRERIEHRGSKATMWIENVIRYIPIPFLLTNSGFALMVNTTRRIDFDLGATDQERFGFEGRPASLDYYFFKGDSLTGLLDLYTSLTGRPPMPPKWTFGLRFVCHMHVNAHEMLDNCRGFRQNDFPCDSVGLEPGWMEKSYDFSIDKKWHPERFYMPSWTNSEQGNFFAAARNLGFKPGLWLCNDYDLSYEEERQLKGSVQNEVKSESIGHLDQAIEQDQHFALDCRLDQLTKPDQPWYEHLKKFVDWGAEYFKMDGANQTDAHPDRLYGNGMKDDEMHNLYPLLYSRQMCHGFRQHTGRRASIFTPNGWLGLQCFPGTWTGDTGGGSKTLVACLNLVLSGHSYATCDMDNTRTEGMHFGFLLPWAQLCSWGYWKHPWFLTEKNQQIFRDYDKLRYRLLPYIYSMAYKAYQTGLPIMRALPMEFPSDMKCRQVLNEYMFGDSFLVSAFDRKTYLPEGEWIDYWTGKKHKGPREFEYTPPENRGGGLFMKAGATIPMGPDIAYVGQKPDMELTLDIYPSGESEFVLYEDDGISYEYEKGVCAKTLISVRSKSNVKSINIGARKGAYAGMPEKRVYLLKVRLEKTPSKVTLNKIPLKKMADKKSITTVMAKRSWSYDNADKTLWVNINADAGVVEISCPN